MSPEPPRGGSPPRRPAGTGFAERRPRRLPGIVAAPTIEKK